MPDLVPQSLPRPRYTFTIPEAARAFPEDPHQFVMVPITVQEERDANLVADAAKTMVSYEYIKHAVIEVDGKALSWNGTGRDWIERASPKVRELAVAAFARVNRSNEEEVKAFLAGVVVEAT